MDARSGRHRRKGTGGRSLALAIASSFVFSSIWAAEPRIHFNIPAGTLANAIYELGHQANVTVYYGSTTDALDANKLTTQAVIGSFDLPEALTRMLEGTGLTFRFTPDGEVLIAPNKAPATVQRVSPAGVRAVVYESPSTEPAAVQQIVVTGSFIRGLDAITAPVIMVSKKDQQKSAYGTVQDVLRTLPQTFGGGPSEDFSTSANFNRGSSVDLRGLGPGATLVLVNGRRQPVSSIDGNFVDVSTIPWTAVDRIEVLTDGASALYGSDAVAGVVNILMREDLSGIGETQLRMGSSAGGADESLLSQSIGSHWDSGKWLLTYQYSRRTALASADRKYAASDDKRPFGGSDLRSFFSSPGNILNPATQQPAFGIPPGQDGRSLSADQLLPEINLYNRRETSDLLPDTSTHSAFFTASQRIGERVELFAEGRFGQRHVSATERAQELLLFVPSSNPFFVNPFGGLPFVMVAYNFSGELGPIRDTGITDVHTGAMSMKVSLSDRWQTTLSGYFGKESMRWLGYNQINASALAEKLADPNPAVAFNPFGSGSNTNSATLEDIRIIQDERAVSKLKAINFVANGSLPKLSIGTPRLAVGFDFRHETLNRGLSPLQYERRIGAAFAEVSMPLGPRLDISLAARYEAYSNFGDTFNPKIGFRWEATDWLRFRGSWGSSFRAPTLVNLYDRSNDAAGMFLLPDPHSESGFSTVIAEQGSNSNLREETAKTWTAGIDFAPSIVPGLSLSGTYYIIDYIDRIFPFPPTVGFSDLLADDQWSPLVTRNPSRLEVERICDTPLFFGSRTDCLASSPVLLDLRLRNLAATKVKGIDVKLGLALQTHYGGFDFALTGSNTLSFQQSLTRTAVVVDLAGIVLNPSALRLRGTMDWYRHGQNLPGFGASLAVDHLKGSRDYDHPLVTRIDPWTTLDFLLSYRTQPSAAWLADVEFVLNAVNVFDRDPPFVNREEGYDPANADPIGRVINLSVRKSW